VVVVAAPLILPASLRPWPVVLGLTVVVALAPPLLFVSRYVWSEPLFIALVVGFLAAIGRALEERSWRWLCLAAGCAALASLTRSGGVAGILPGAACVLAGRSGDRRRTVGRAAVFAIVAGLPLLLWLARNRIVTGRLTGPRGWSTDPMLVHIRRSAG